MVKKKSKPPASPNRSLKRQGLRFLRRLIKLALLLAICFCVYLTIVRMRPDMAHQALQQVNTPMKYAQLMMQDSPTDNSLPNPLGDAHLTDTWGAARSGGRSHEGIDIFAARGTPILSTTPGIVRKVGTNKLGGNVVSIIGPGGIGHYYAHLEKHADIKEGDWIEAGDIIGYVGNSGNANGTPPHLHYGIYTREGAVNPYPLLVK